MLAFAARMVVATSIVAGFVLLGVLVVYAADLLLLLFAGVLVSIPMRRLAGLLQGTTRLGYGAALAIVTVSLIGAVVAITALAAGRVAAHASELTIQLRAALANVAVRLEGYPWAQDAIARLPDLGDVLLGSGGLLSRVRGFASTTLGAMVNVIVVLAVAIYISSQPGLYAAGIRRLVPPGYRPRIDEVLAALDEALGRWIVGRLILMVINGGFTAVALSLLGVPLALTLGVIAGLLNAIPNFGPFIAAVPAILIAWIDSTRLALYTAVVYVVIQMVDGYVMTPLIDRRSVELPPVLTISAQLLLGVLLGFVGLLVASPLTATILILVKMLYVEDVLGDPITRGSGHSRGEQS